MSDHRYGVSTHLFHEQRLTREHLVHIAGHGFETVELFATRAHFDYHDDRAIDELAEWLDDAGLELHSVHAPVFDALKHGQWIGAYSIAAADEGRRRDALAQIERALRITARIPFRYLVLHLGVPRQDVPGDNRADAARRSIQEIAGAAHEAGVRLALEVMPNALSTPAALVRLIEEHLEGLDVGICLDYGHAHLMGDLGEAIETVSGHLWTTHVHDNGGRRDDHLVPFAGSIDWEAAMVATQKIGYDGALMLEVADTGDALDVLARSAKARERLERSFVTF